MSNNDELINKLITNFRNNLSFLQRFDKKLFERVNSLSIVLENGMYTERYSLEIIPETNEFDILDKATNEYLYNKDIKNFEKDALENCNFDLKNCFNMVNNDMFEKKIVDLSNLQTIDDYEINKYKIATALKQFYNIYKPNYSDLNLNVKEIEKFVFFGTLLGTHIPKISQKLSPKYLFICENNLEIFRLSLFLVNYETISRKTHLVFSIMDDTKDFLNKFRNFFNIHIKNISFLKYFSTNYNVSDYINLLTNIILEFSPTRYDYENMINITLKNGINASKNYPLLNLNTIDKNEELLKQKVLLVAASSLSKNLEWIKQNQDYFIIVSIGASLKKLLSYGITPDIITSADPQYFITVNHFNVDISIIKDSIKLFTNNSHTNLFKKFQNDENLYLLETIFKLINKICLEGVSVGELTFMTLLLLGFKEIYFLGVDLALDRLTNATHLQDYFSNTNYNDLDLNNVDITKKNTLNHKDLVEIICNDGIIGHTSRLFYTSINYYISFYHQYNINNTKVYNLSREGAKIDTIEFLDIKNLQLVKKIDKTLINPFFKLYSNKISLDIKNNIEEHIKFLSKKILQLNEFKKTKINKYHDFKNFSDKFYLDILKNTKFNYLFEIIHNYCLFVDRYINFSFNTCKDNLNYDMYKFLWSEQLIYLLYTYINQLKKLTD